MSNNTNKAQEYKMPSKRNLDLVWFLLMLATLSSAFIAESAEPSFFVTLVLSFAVALKGRLVVDYFMGLRTANPLIKRLMRAYFFVIPAMIILVYLFPETLASWTTLKA